MGIIGENISQKLSDQIKIRQEKLGKSVQDTENIIYTNSKTSWLRVVSSVDITDASSAGIGDLDIPNGDELAKNLILMGPAINSKGNIPNSIFPSSNSLSSQAKSLLGVGGDTTKWGATPPPGVESVSIQALNRGAIRKGQIKIKAHNPDQFRLLEVLYLRLGFTILVEWGHTVYYDNNGNLQQYNDFATGPFTKMLNGGDFGSIVEELGKEREKKDHNYDGFLGYISNFNWTFNSDGTYDITLDIISRGGLIDSLTANKSGASKEIPTAVGGSGTIISEFLKFFYQRFKIATSNPDATLPGGSPASDAVYDAEVKTQQGKTVISYRSSGDSDTEELFGFPLPTQEGFFEGEVERFQMLYNDYKVNTSMGVENDFYYVSMGLLLRIISERCLVYEEDKETPIIKINSNYGEHFMLSHPFQQSTDPRICKLDNRTEGVYLADVNFNGPLLPGEELPSYGYKASSTPKAKNNLFRSSGTINTPVSNPFSGDIMGIMVNMGFVIKALQEKKDEEGNVNLKEYLTYILDEITKVTGAINRFNVSYSEETNEVVIYDDNTIPGKMGTVKSTPIHLYGLGSKNSSKKDTLGLGSFVTNVNFSSKIFPKIQNSVAIAAQNPDGGGVGDKVSSFSRLNAGIKDRTARGAQGYYDGSSSAKQPTINKFTKEIYDVTEHFLNVYNQRVLTSKQDELEDMSNALKNILEYDMAFRAEGGSIPPPYFIPVELSLELDGLSGFKLYEQFDITPDYILPPSYPNNLNFIIQGVDHNLNNGNWTTTLKALSWTADEATFIFDGKVFAGDKPTPAPAPNPKENDGPPPSTFDGFANPALEPFIETFGGSIAENFGVPSGTRISPEEAVKFVHPLVRVKMKRFLENILANPKMKGGKVVLTSSLRTFPQQQKLHNQNPSNAKAGLSKHNYGCAFDMNIYDQNGTKVAGKYDPGSRDNVKYVWAQLGIVDNATEAGLNTWGGNFKSYFDPVHFGTAVNVNASFEKAKEYAAAEGISYKDIGVEIFNIDIVLKT